MDPAQYKPVRHELSNPSGYKKKTQINLFQAGGPALWSLLPIRSTSPSAADEVNLAY
jgi:hypothetical protein